MSEAGTVPLDGVTAAGEGATLPVTASPLDLPAELFRAGLDRRRQNREALLAWIRAALVEGIDYGRIHAVGKQRCPFAARGEAEACPNPKHWSKPCLFKPGAEKICGMLGVTVHYPTLVEYERAALNGLALTHIILRCELRDASGRVVADGVGARALAQDYGDLNKALKMSAKASQIDATLRMAGLSEVFTQDLEDLRHGEELDTHTAHTAADFSEGETPAADDAPPAPCQVDAGQGADTARITAAQHRRLEARIGALKLDRERVKAWLARASHGRVQHFTDMPRAIYDVLDAKLLEWARADAAAEDEPRDNTPPH